MPRDRWKPNDRNSRKRPAPQSSTTNHWAGFVGHAHEESSTPVLLTGMQVASKVNAASHPSGIQPPGPRPAVPIESQEYRDWYERWYAYSQATGDMTYEEMQVDTSSSDAQQYGGYGEEQGVSSEPYQHGYETGRSSQQPPSQTHPASFDDRFQPRNQPAAPGTENHTMSMNDRMVSHNRDFGQPDNGFGQRENKRNDRYDNRNNPDMQVDRRDNVNRIDQMDRGREKFERRDTDRHDNAGRRDNAGRPDNTGRQHSTGRQSDFDRRADTDMRNHMGSANPQSGGGVPSLMSLAVDQPPTKRIELEHERSDQRSGPYSPQNSKGFNQSDHGRSHRGTSKVGKSEQPIEAGNLQLGAVNPMAMMGMMGEMMKKAMESNPSEMGALMAQLSKPGDQKAMESAMKQVFVLAAGDKHGKPANSINQFQQQRPATNDGRDHRFHDSSGPRGGRNEPEMGPHGNSRGFKNITGPQENKAPQDSMGNYGRFGHQVESSLNDSQGDMGQSYDSFHSGQSRANRGQMGPMNMNSRGMLQGNTWNSNAPSNSVNLGHGEGIGPMDQYHQSNTMAQNNQNFSAPLPDMPYQENNPPLPSQPEYAGPGQLFPSYQQAAVGSSNDYDPAHPGDWSEPGPPAKMLKMDPNVTDLNPNQLSYPGGIVSLPPENLPPRNVERSHLLFCDQVRKAKRTGIEISRLFIRCQVCEDLWGEKSHSILEYVNHHLNSQDHCKAMIAWLDTHPNPRYKKLLETPPFKLRYDGNKKDPLSKKLKTAYFCEVCEVPAGYCRKIYKQHVKEPDHINRLMKLTNAVRRKKNATKQAKELKDVEYLLLPQRMPKLTKERDRFRQFPCQVCSIAANDVGDLCFDNWIEHICTPFHMSVLYDWLARVKAPASVHYQKFLKFKPSEMTQKNEPHYFCEVCLKKVEHVDEYIESHLTSEKHSKKMLALRHSLEQSLSGGPVTRIPSDNEETDLDAYTQDLESEWVHPTTAKLNASEADVTQDEPSSPVKQPKQKIYQPSQINNPLQQQAAQINQQWQPPNQQLPNQNMVQQNMQGPNMMPPNLQGPNMMTPNMPGPSMPGPNMPGPNMPGPMIPGTNMAGPNMPGPTMSMENMQALMMMGQRMMMAQKMAQNMPQGVQGPMQNMPQGVQGPMQNMPQGVQGPMQNMPQGIQGPMQNMPQGVQGPMQNMPQGVQGPMQNMPQGAQGPKQNMPGPNMPGQNMQVPNHPAQNNQGPNMPGQNRIMPDIIRPRMQAPNMPGPNMLGPGMQGQNIIRPNMPRPNKQMPDKFGSQQLLKKKLPEQHQGPIPLMALDTPAKLIDFGRPADRDRDRRDRDRGDRRVRENSEERRMSAYERRARQTEKRRERRISEKRRQAEEDEKVRIQLEQIAKQQAEQREREEFRHGQQNERDRRERQLREKRESRERERERGNYNQRQSSEKLTADKMLSVPRSNPPVDKPPTIELGLEEEHVEQESEDPKKAVEKQIDYNIGQLNINFTGNKPDNVSLPKVPVTQPPPSEATQPIQQQAQHQTPLVLPPNSVRLGGSPQEYMLFPKILQVLSTRPQFPVGAHCQVCEDLPKFSNVIEWAAHINTLPHMMALYRLIKRGEGQTFQMLMTKFVLPNDATGKLFYFCEICEYIGPEQNMKVHITGKKHMVALKTMAHHMRNMSQWMNEYMRDNRHDFWNVQADGNPKVVQAAQSAVQSNRKSKSSDRRNTRRDTRDDTRHDSRDDTRRDSRDDTRRDSKGDSRRDSTGGSTVSLFDLKDPQMKFLHEILEGVMALSAFKHLKEAGGRIDNSTQKQIADTQRALVEKMCTTNGHLVIAIARRVTENEKREKILEFYPEVNPPLIDIISGLKPDILTLIAGTPILDKPPS